MLLSLYISCSILVSFILFYSILQVVVLTQPEAGLAAANCCVRTTSGFSGCSDTLSHHHSCLWLHLYPHHSVCHECSKTGSTALHCAPTLGKNSCLCLLAHIHAWSSLFLAGLPHIFSHDTVMQSNTRVTLGPSERHPGGAAKFLIWPQNLLACSYFLKDSSHVPWH